MSDMTFKVLATYLIINTAIHNVWSKLRLELIVFNCSKYVHIHK